MKPLFEFWHKALSEGNNSAPGGTIALFSGDIPQLDLAVTYEALMRHLVGIDNTKPVYEQFYQICSRNSKTSVDKLAFDKLSSSPEFIKLIGKPLVKNPPNFIHLEEYDAEKLLHIISNLPKGSSIFVNNSNLYRFLNIENHSIDGNADTDKLIREALSISEQKELLLILAFESYGFVQTDIPQELMHAENLCVFTAHVSEVEAAMSMAFKKCVNLEGNVTPEAIVELIPHEEDHKSARTFMRAQALTIHGYHTRAWNEMSTIIETLYSSPKTEGLVIAADIAYKADLTKEAAEILNKISVNRLNQLQELKVIYTLANNIENASIADQALKRAHLLFPRDRAFSCVVIKEALNSKEYSKAQETALLINDGYMHALAVFLESNGSDVKSFITSAQQEDKESEAYYEVSAVCFTRGHYRACIRLLRKSDNSDKCMKLKWEALLHRFIGHGLNPFILIEMKSILEFVALESNRESLRNALVNSFESELDFSSLMAGMTFLLTNEIQKLRPNHHIYEKENDSRQQSESRDDTLKSSCNILLELVRETEMPISFGSGEIPEKIRPRLNQTTLKDWISFLQTSVRTNQYDYKTFTLVLHYVILLSRDLNDPTSGSLALNYGVMVLSSKDEYQKARDLAENSLILVPDKSDEFFNWKTSLAWLSLSEASQRSHYHLLAQFYLLLSVLSAPKEIPSIKGVKEIFRLAARIHRDLRLIPWSLSYIDYEIEINDTYKVDSNVDYQLVQMRHSIRSINALSTKNTEEIIKLVIEALEFLKTQEDDEVAPMFSNLVSLMSTLKALNFDAFQKFSEPLQCYSDLLDPNTRLLLSGTIESKINTKTLTSLAAAVGNALNHSDLARQLYPLKIAAERAINQAFENQDHELFIVASAILSQPTLTSSIQGDGISINTSKLNDYAKHLKSETEALTSTIEESQIHYKKYENSKLPSISDTINIQVHEIQSALKSDEIALILCRDHTGHLYSTEINSESIGRICHTEEKNWNPESFELWSTEYPYAYGTWISDTPSTDDRELISKKVHESLLQLSIQNIDPSKRYTIVCDSELYGFPFSIINDYRENIPVSISCSPSLRWLNNVRNRTEQNHGIKSWFGVPGRRDFTMEYLCAKIMKTIEDPRIEISHDEHPEALSNSSIAIVGAHGGISSSSNFSNISVNGRYFYSLNEFSKYFENVDCVILLVCSSGKSDSIKNIAEAWGIVTQLFNLGVRTVIAPIWPLHIDIAAVWLEAFLSSVYDQNDVGTANTQALKAIKARYDHPCAWGNIHVFGDASYMPEIERPK